MALATTIKKKFEPVWAFFNYVEKRGWKGSQLFVNSYKVENVNVGGRWSKKAKIS